MVSTDIRFLGRGIYGLTEAARLLRRPPAQVRRWANGYTYARTYDRGQRPPVLQTPREEKGVLTFQELVELFFVREYTSAGVPLQHVRDTAAALAERYGPLPFASQPLLTDGRRLLEVSEYGLITPSTSQLIADFADAFVSEVEFADDFVNLWRPKEGERFVVVDPARAMGEPILDAVGTPTRLLYKTYLKEQDFERVGDYYDVAAGLVKQAVEFELRFANAA